MHNISIRKIPSEVHAALRVRAARHGRSLEAELREILADAAREESAVGIGTLLQRFGEAHGGLEFDEIDEPVQAADLR